MTDASQEGTLADLISTALFESELWFTWTGKELKTYDNKRGDARKATARIAAEVAACYYSAHKADTT